MNTNDTQLLPAPLVALIAATGPYAVEVSGNALAPKLYDGDKVAIYPAVGKEPIPGSLVLVALENPHSPGCFDRCGLYLVNGDGDLRAGSQFVEKGKYLLLGTEWDGE